ncbi:hypothetical protein LJC21_00365 [Bacteroides sp. OttesenSCG-928-E20]|nr:hypothetical protein [Bacteroides sp. OttesenSCG-928-E20]
MIKRERSIELLNKAVAEEMTAVHQYMYFHFRLDDMGYDFLANQFKRTAIVEMMHVEKLAERILFLKGEVELKTEKLTNGTNIIWNRSRNRILTTYLLKYRASMHSFIR